MQLLLWPELNAPLGKLLLFVGAWVSWAALWLALAFFLLVELVALGAPFLATQRGISVGLWCWLLVGVGLLLTGVAWLNYKNSKDLLAAGRRAELEHAVAAAALFSIVILALALARRPRRPALLFSLATSALLLAWLWGSWLRSPADQPRPLVPAPVALVAHPPPILIVVWEAADLGVLLPAMERGDMPFLKRRWSEGSWGQLRTLRPYARAAALTTLVTGCLPSEHGTVGRRVYRLEWLQAEPLSLLLEGPWPTPHQLPWRLWERAAAPPPRRATVWQVFQSAGLRVGLVGWYAPARATWVVPRVLAAEASPFETLDSALQTVLAPALGRSREAATLTREAFAVVAEEFARTRDLLRAEPVDALLVVSDLLGRLRPLWTAPAGDPAADEVLRQALGLLDDQLATLWHALGGEDVVLVVVSPYGMTAPGSWTRLKDAVRGHRRWRVSPSARADGFVFFAGPAATKGKRMSGARVADVTPTLLYMVDLPLAQDMSGKVLLDAIPEELAASRPLRLIPSYPNPDRTR